MTPAREYPIENASVYLRRRRTLKPMFSLSRTVILLRGNSALVGFDILDKMQSEETVWMRSEAYAGPYIFILPLCTYFRVEVSGKNPSSPSCTPLS